MYGAPYEDDDFDSDYAAQPVTGRLTPGYTTPVTPGTTYYPWEKRSEYGTPEYYGEEEEGKSYEVHDSGSKSQYGDGMRRDTADGKPRFDLIFPENVPYEKQLLTRVAMQYYAGGQKYGDRNWERSSTQESLDHHKAALMRHVLKFLTNTNDGEDHAAAIVWNVNAVDLTRTNMARKLEIDSITHSFAHHDRTPIYNWPEEAEER